MEASPPPPAASSRKKKPGKHLPKDQKSSAKEMTRLFLATALRQKDYQGWILAGREDIHTADFIGGSVNKKAYVRKVRRLLKRQCEDCIVDTAPLQREGDFRIWASVLFRSPPSDQPLDTVENR